MLLNGTGGENDSVRVCGRNGKAAENRSFAGSIVKKLEFARTIFSTEDIQMYSIAIIRISAR